MRTTLIQGALLLSALSLATACGNPAVDPDATFTAKGTVQNELGQPLNGAEVRLIKYSSDLQLLAPTVDELFSDSPRGDNEVGLDVSVVKTITTGADGTFSMTFTGADIAAPGGYTTGEGLVEVATVVLVVRDPADPLKRAGVYTYPKLFMQSDKEWGAGTMKLLASEAIADTSIANINGLVKLSWKKIPQGSSMVRNTYRVTIGAPDNTSPRLIIRCNEGNDVVDGQCTQDPENPAKVSRFISAYSLYRYYSSGGMFAAYLEANSPDYRFVSKFAVPAPVPNNTGDRTDVGIEGLWAVSTSADQPLLNTPATDGNPDTRVAITIPNATAIYAKLTPALVSDAGVLNTVLRNAENGCVILEFSVTAFPDLAGAKGSSAAMWVKKGKFCGENGAKDEISALAGFDTTGSDGVVAAWMRVRAEADGAGSNPYFQAIGEVAVLKKR